MEGGVCVCVGGGDLDFSGHLVEKKKEGRHQSVQCTLGVDVAFTK